MIRDAVLNVACVAIGTALVAAVYILPYVIPREER